MYKLVFFVPENEKEFVKEQLFQVGAGHYDGYEKCSWEVLGTGQFLPLSGSNPFIGKQGALERVNEYRVEMVCDDSIIKKVVEKLIDSHPYEEPAYEAWKIETLKDL